MNYAIKRHIKGKRGRMENKEIIELESKALAVDEQARTIVIKSQE